MATTSAATAATATQFSRAPSPGSTVTTTAGQTYRAGRCRARECSASSGTSSAAGFCNPAACELQQRTVTRTKTGTGASRRQISGTGSSTAATQSAGPVAVTVAPVRPVRMIPQARAASVAIPASTARGLIRPVWTTYGSRLQSTIPPAASARSTQPAVTSAAGPGFSIVNGFPPSRTA